ncbi:MAG: EamA family transporter [Chloroflexota bacterium]|nr:EamA family transporter [Chloroflexota bacterium]
MTSLLRSTRLYMVLAFFGVPVLWGINWTFMKIGLESLPPFLLLGCRQLVAGGFFVLLARARGSQFPRGRLMAWAIVLGFVMTGFSNGAMFWGVQYITSGLASILFGTMPFFAAAFAHFWNRERLNVWSVLGIIVGFAGVALLLGNRVGAQSAMALWGQVALLVSAVTWAMPLVLSRRWLSHEDTIALTGIQMLAGAGLLVPLGLVSEGLDRVHMVASGWVALVYMTVASGGLGFVLYFWLMRRLGATRLSLTSFVTPVVAVISGIVVLGEPVEANLFIGLALIAVGIGVVSLVGEAGGPVAARHPSDVPARVMAGAVMYTADRDSLFYEKTISPKEH